MKKLFAFLFIGFLFTHCTSVKSQISQEPTIIQNNKPTLIVGVVIDQMRYDYLIKFYNKYGGGGFKRLMNDGYHLENVHYNYIPTYTAVGHTSIYTGTTPVNHGIIGNNWYDKIEKKSIYCVDDSNYKTVGALKGGEKSPYRMVTTTVTDQLRLAQNMRGKTIGIALKDRSSILPAGHTANAAYWFEGNDEGKFISSTFYMNELPNWVTQFNNSGKANSYLNLTWDTYYDISTYTESLSDNNEFEGTFKGKETPTFPYNLAELRKNNDNYDLLKAVPFGNSITTDFSIATLEGEQLGKGEFTDFLAISYSSPDYIGHQFGINAIEIEDNYIRLDKDIERLINYLDKEIGAENYTLFLTADHAAVPVPAYLNTLKIPAGYFDSKAFKTYVNDLCLKLYNSDKIVENISNYQLFLNRETLNMLNLDIEKVSQQLADELINYTSIYKTVTARTLQTTSFTSGILQTLQNGYNQKLSGDVFYVPYPATISYSKTGTTHGSGYVYDTHVPLIFYGNGIKKGKSNAYYSIIDIAPTLSSLLQITEPNGSTGNTILEVLE
jgi:predicted AlkP superfamily pyrophosphatase or phosphodiesterase